MELKDYKYKCKDCGNENVIKAEWFNNKLERKVHNCEYCLRKTTLNVSKIRGRDYNNFLMKTEIVGGFSGKDSQVFITVSSPDGKGQFELKKDNNEIFIGRGKELKFEKGHPDYKPEGFAIDTVLKIPDGFVSRKHAVIKKGGMGGKTLILVELGSLNGTYINGTKLSPGDEVVLGSGSEIKMGETVIKIEN